MFLAFYSFFGRILWLVIKYSVITSCSNFHHSAHFLQIGSPLNRNSLGTSHYLMKYAKVWSCENFYIYIQIFVLIQKVTKKMRILFSAFQCLYFWKFPSHCLQISTYLSRNITLQISAILMNENWNAFAQEWNLLNKLEIQNEFSKTSLFWVSHTVKTYTYVISLR